MNVRQTLSELGARIRLAGSIMMDGRPSASIRTSADLAAYIWGRTSTSGAVVSDETAWKVSVINACTRVLAEGVASLPLHVFTSRADGGKERDRNSGIDRLLSIRPNRWQTSIEWREMMQAHAVRRGNGCSLIVRSGTTKEPMELIPLHPDRIVWGLEGSRLWYEYTNPEGRKIPYRQEDIFHLRGLSSDGISGRSAIDDLRDSIGISMQQENWESLSYARGGTKRAVLRHPKTLNAGTAKRIRESWVEAQGKGADGMWMPVVLEDGMELDSLTLSASDLQFIESRKFRIAELARPFRVPLHLLQDLDRSTNNNIETQSLEFLIYTLTPWLVRWEQRIQVDLLGVDSDRFAKHNVGGMLRGDVEKRGDYYSKALTNGWMSIDEVRALEDMNPLENGEGKKHRVPVNVQEAGAPAPRPAPQEEPA